MANRSGADDVQVLVPYKLLAELMELPKEVAQLKKELAQLKRRVEGGDGIHYDLMCKIQELKELL